MIGQAAPISDAGRTALPRLFAEIDELRRRTRGVAIVAVVR